MTWPKCKGLFYRHRWNPETNKCKRCAASRNPEAKPLEKKAA